MQNVTRLLEMLTYRRAHGTEGERLFVEKYITPYEPEVFIDPQGETLAYCISVGDSDVMWSSHVDTVDPYKVGSVGRKVNYDAEFMTAWCEDEILGADDGAGVWLMLEMIDAGVPGNYIFHRGEERGGIGSKGMAKHFADYLSTFTHAIAFDRRGVQDVITHQAIGRCCSDEFAAYFADALDMTHRPDPSGVYTDTAEYTDLIGECTNISVGYEGEHMKGESLDVSYLLQLRDAIIHASRGCSFDNLPQVRKPGEVDPEDTYSSWRGCFNDYENSNFMNMFSNMSYGEILQWVGKTPKEDIADAIFELVESAVYGNDNPVYFDLENQK